VRKFRSVVDTQPSQSMIDGAQRLGKIIVILECATKLADIFPYVARLCRDAHFSERSQQIADRVRWRTQLLKQSGFVELPLKRVAQFVIA
jgi:hypothetical protein